MLLACAAKSISGRVSCLACCSRLLKLSPPVARCSRLMQPKPRLSSSTMISFWPIMTEVAISEFIIRYEPSPSMTTTSRSGSAIFTPRPPAIS